MKKIALFATLTLAASAAQAATTINATNRHAYGANVGWVNFRSDVTNGAAIGLYYSTGYVWSANCGWIGLGSVRRPMATATPTTPPRTGA